MKKYLGAILSALGVMLYYAAIFIFVGLNADIPLIIRAVVFFVSISITIGLLVVLFKRIKEIKKGEVDNAVGNY